MSGGVTDSLSPVAAADVGSHGVPVSTEVIDEDGQVIDVLLSTRRDADAARRFFRRALAASKVTPGEFVT